MTEFRMKEVRALLNTTMESVLRRAMFEIMKIVENSLHDHQLELAQKGEEIVQLKVKLQGMEMKLRDALYTDGPVAQMNNQMGEMQGEPKVATNATPQVLVPETDFEIPEDWCAPVGDDTPTNADDGSCPSVRLRQLSIPLYPVPVAKKQVAQQGIEPHQGAKVLRRSKRGSLSMQEGNQMPDKSLTATDQKRPRKKVRSDIAMLLQENAQHLNTGLRSRGKNSTGKPQQEVPSTGEVRESAATNSETVEQPTLENSGAIAHFCGFCKASFDSEFGRDVHERFHKWCRGCKNTFPSPDSLVTHKSQCKKLIALMAKNTRSQAASGALSNDTEKQTTPSLELLRNKQDSPANNIESVIQNHRVVKKNTCVVCKKEFTSSTRQEEHMRIHTGERPFFCRLCPKKFRGKQALKGHMMRIHKEEVNSEPTEGDLAWTESLEVTGELFPPGKDISVSVNQMELFGKETFGSKGKSLEWKKCGTQVPGGFSCNVCAKLKTNKSTLVEHYRVHTGEKPFKCPYCHSLFRFQGQFSAHCRKCSQNLCDKDMSNRLTLQ